MRLAVIIEDRIAELAAKGEILDGYFNPAGAFDHVAVVSLFESAVPAAAAAGLCAPAAAEILAGGLDRKQLMLDTVGLRPRALRRAVAPLAAAIAATRPRIVRAYGDGLAAIVAAAAAGDAGVPFVVSLHTTPDRRARTRLLPWRDRLWRALLRPAAAPALDAAAALMPVYSPILDTLPAPLRAKARVLHNVVGVAAPVPRRPAAAGEGLRVLWVGRQMRGRDPRPVVEALAAVGSAALTLVGDGPLHDAATAIARRHGIMDRVRFIRSLDNRRLCASLGDYDVMAVHTLYRELPKSVMEAALAGLPLIVNEDPSAGIAEYRGAPVVWVDGSAASYARALAGLTERPAERLDRGAGVAAQAWRRWQPSLVARATADCMVAIAESQGSGSA